jgi:hypothetical protein
MVAIEFRRGKHFMSIYKLLSLSWIVGSFLVLFINLVGSVPYGFRSLLNFNAVGEGWFEFSVSVLVLPYAFWFLYEHGIKELSR